jgi:methyl-accepting chemotaxis protein
MGEVVITRNVQRFQLKVSEFIDSPSDIARVAALNAGALAVHGNMSRDTFSAHFAEIVAGSPSVNGMGFMFEANTFDNERFSGYMLRNSNGTARELPADAEAYNESFYSDVMRSGRIILLEPHTDILDGRTHQMVAIAAPIVCPESGAVLGVVYADILLDGLYELFSNLGIYDTSYAMITTGDGKILYSPLPEYWMRNVSDRDVDMRLASSPNEPMFDGNDGNNVKSKITGASSYAYTMPVNFRHVDDVYFVSLVIPWNEIYSIPYTILYALGAALFLAAIILPLLVSRVVSKKLKPLDAITAASHDMAVGNFNFNLPQATNDEIGVLGSNFRELTQTFRNLIQSMEDVSEKHEQGYSGARLYVGDFKGTYVEVTTAINKMLDHSDSVKAEAMNCIVEIVNGNFNATVRQFSGEEAALNVTIEELRNIIKSLAQAIEKIILHASNGNTSYKLDPYRYKGNWVQLIEGLNEILQKIHEPLSASIDVIKSMEQGDFNERVEGAFKGEFLIIKDALNLTVEAISSYINEINDVLGKLASGNLRTGITRNYIGQFATIKDSINGIVNEMNKTIGEISAASNQVSIGAERISDSSSQLAQGAAQQASSLQELSEITTKISDGSAENAENASQASGLADTSKHNAEEGSKEMNQLLISMDEINDSSKRISNIIKTIEDIAFQTNLLALNAAVEAARAGEHGKGFAVVAEEVRNLAVRSNDAARETGALIQETIVRVSSGSSRASETAASLSKIVSNIMDISEVISKIYQSSAQQKEDISLISSGINQINEVVQNNQATSEESAAAAEELNSQAETLRQLIQFFRT